MLRTTFLTLRFGRDHWYWTGVVGTITLIAVLVVLQMNPAVPVMGGETDESVPLAKIGEPAPDFALSTLHGETFRLSSLRGRPVILYFWASWCTFCREEMPRLNATYKAYQDDSDLIVLGINILEDPSIVRSYMDNFGISFPILLDRDGATSQHYLVRATPSYYFIDRDGILQGRIIGAVRPPTFRARLHAILQAPPLGDDSEASSLNRNLPAVVPRLF